MFAYPARCISLYINNLSHRICIFFRPLYRYCAIVRSPSCHSISLTKLTTGRRNRSSWVSLSDIYYPSSLFAPPMSSLTPPKTMLKLSLKIKVATEKLSAFTTPEDDTHLVTRLQSRRIIIYGTYQGPMQFCAVVNIKT